MKNVTRLIGGGRGPRKPSSEGRDAARAREGALARFSSLYESRDGRLMLFEDAQGHLQAVDAKRLA